MYEFLKELTYDDLDEEQKELADCIGIDNYKSLINTYGGTNINIRLPETICINIRNKKICSEFDGGNYNNLAKKYRLSAVSVRRIISAQYKK